MAGPVFPVFPRPDASPCLIPMTRYGCGSCGLRTVIQRKISYQGIGPSRVPGCLRA